MNMSECYFIPDKKTSSATICVNCGREKMFHTIGEELGVVDNKVTLRPSIGNFNGETPYHAHYYITDNKIRWL